MRLIDEVIVVVMTLKGFDANNVPKSNLLMVLFTRPLYEAIPMQLTNKKIIML